MSTDRTVFHVVPDASGDAWLVTRENDDAFREEYRTKDEAEVAAKGLARERAPSQVKVHRQDGDMEYESTYEADPRRTPS